MIQDFEGKTRFRQQDNWKILRHLAPGFSPLLVSKRGTSLHGLIPSGQVETAGRLQGCHDTPQHTPLSCLHWMEIEAVNTDDGVRSDIAEGDDVHNSEDHS